MNSEIEKILYLEEEREKEIWKNSLVIFDTSALLALYDYTDTFRAKFYKEVLDKFENRLVITGHTEYEFFKNRKSKIRNPINQKLEPFREKLIELISSPINELKSNLKHLKNDTKKDDQVPYLDQNIFTNVLKVVDELQGESDKLIVQIKELLAKQIEDIEKLEDNDSVYPKLNEYFKLGSKMTFKEKIELIKNEGELRFRNDIPPGYKDDPKNNSKSKKEGMQIYGDLYIWKETIKIAIENKCNILFVTNDLKEDWCVKNPDRNGSIKHPRFDLITEFRSNTNQEFWMYSISDILYFANRYLDAKFTEKEIEVIESLVIEEEYDPIPGTIDNVLEGIIESVEWDFKNKRVITENEEHYGRDTFITNVQDLIDSLNEDVTNIAIAYFPLHYIKEFGPFDYEGEVVNYLLENKKQELIIIGWYDEL
jgi:hypothetical protein